MARCAAALELEAYTSASDLELMAELVGRRPRDADIPAHLGGSLVVRAVAGRDACLYTGLPADGRAVDVALQTWMPCLMKSMASTTKVVSRQPELRTRKHRRHLPRRSRRVSVS